MRMRRRRQVRCRSVVRQRHAGRLGERDRSVRQRRHGGRLFFGSTRAKRQHDTTHTTHTHIHTRPCTAILAVNQSGQMKPGASTSYLHKSVVVIGVVGVNVNVSATIPGFPGIADGQGSRARHTPGGRG